MYGCQISVGFRGGRKIITKLLSGDSSHGALLGFFGLGPLLSLSRDIETQW